MLFVTGKVRPVDRERAGESQIHAEHNMLVLLPHPLIPKGYFFGEFFLLKLFLAFDTEYINLSSLFFFFFADNLTDRCEKMVCLCDQEAAKCWGAAPYNPHFILWPDFLCGQTHPTCHVRHGGPE